MHFEPVEDSRQKFQFHKPGPFFLFFPAKLQYSCGNRSECPVWESSGQKHYRDFEKGGILLPPGFFWQKAVF